VQGTAEVVSMSTCSNIQGFQITGDGISDYSQSDVWRYIDRTKPYQAVFDYEIWKGEPLKGELLTKNSVFSKPFRPE
jgi:hypothetical protein